MQVHISQIYFFKTLYLKFEFIYGLDMTNVMRLMFQGLDLTTVASLMFIEHPLIFQAELDGKNLFTDVAVPDWLSYAGTAFYGYTLYINFASFKCSLCYYNNIIIFEFTKILLLSETFRRPIGDPSDTDIPDRRPIGDRHA